MLRNFQLENRVILNPNSRFNYGFGSEHAKNSDPTGSAQQGFISR